MPTPFRYVKAMVMAVCVVIFDQQILAAYFCDFCDFCDFFTGNRASGRLIPDSRVHTTCRAWLSPPCSVFGDPVYEKAVRSSPRDCGAAGHSNPLKGGTSTLLWVVDTVNTRIMDHSATIYTIARNT